MYERVIPYQIGPKKCKNGSDLFRFFSNLAYLLSYMRRWKFQILRFLWPPGASHGALKVLASRLHGLTLRGCNFFVFRDIIKIPTGTCPQRPGLYFLLKPFFDSVILSRPFFGLGFLASIFSRFVILNFSAFLIFIAPISLDQGSKEKPLAICFICLQWASTCSRPKPEFEAETQNP